LGAERNPDARRRFDLGRQLSRGLADGIEIREQILAVGAAREMFASGLGQRREPFLLDGFG
jgi:hypothetical protein